MNVRMQHRSDVRVSGRLDWNSIEWKTVERKVRKLGLLELITIMPENLPNYYLKTQLF